MLSRIANREKLKANLESQWRRMLLSAFSSVRKRSCLTRADAQILHCQFEMRNAMVIASRWPEGEQTPNGRLPEQKQKKRLSCPFSFSLVRSFLSSVFLSLCHRTSANATGGSPASCLSPSGAVQPLCQGYLGLAGLHAASIRFQIPRHRLKVSFGE